MASSARRMRWRSTRRAASGLQTEATTASRSSIRAGKYLESRYIVRTHQRHSHHQGWQGLRHRLGIQPDQPPELEQWRSHRPGRRRSDRRIHSAVQGGHAPLPGRSGRGRHGGCGRQRLRRRGTELHAVRGRPVHEVLGQVTSRQPGTMEILPSVLRQARTPADGASRRPAPPPNHRRRPCS